MKAIKQMAPIAAVLVGGAVLALGLAPPPKASSDREVKTSSRGEVRVVQRSLDLSRLAASGVTFIPSNPAAGQVSESTALTAALGFSHGVLDGTGQVGPGVTASAWYGTLTSEYPAVETGTGLVPAYHDVPSWLVEFTGPGVGARPSGCVGCPAPQWNPTVVETETVAVDAKTGAASFALN